MTVTTSTAVDRIVALLDSPKQSGNTWSARCPAHDDRNPSLSVSPRERGDPGAVIRCHAGCSVDDVLKALGLTERDLFDAQGNGSRKSTMACTYPYSSPAGAVLFETVRFDPKDFRQRRPDGNGGWIWNLQGVERVLYRLPEVLKGVASDLTIFIVEGEKDADRLAVEGFVATTCPMGAGKWSKVADHAREVLAGADVIVIQDRDDTGRAHARDVVSSLTGVVSKITLVEAASGKDVSDHLAAGHTVPELVIVDQDTSPPSDPLVDSSFDPIDLAPVVDGSATQPTPTILRRDDRQALFYPGLINGIHGDSGTGKGWVVLHAVAQQLAAGRHVMVIDTEDVPTSIVARLRILGASDDQLVGRLVYIRPTEPFGLLPVDHLVEICRTRDVSLVVVDSLGECFGLDGIDENSDAEVGPWLRRVVRRLADETGAAVVVVDHSTKANDNPLHPSGSKRKRAAIGGASYLVTATVPLTSSAGGRLQLTCAKDRHGTYARSEHVADFVMKVDGVLGTRVELYAPAAATVVDLPIELAARAAVTAVTEHGPMSLRVLRETMTFKGRNEARVAGIELAVSRGDLIEQSGPHRARLFSLPEEPQP